MSNNSNQASGGIGCGGALALIFITLKLTGNIDWSWWWVLAPVWGPLALIALGLVIYLLVAVCVEFAKTGARR